jgi:hypothetical protein
MATNWPRQPRQPGENSHTLFRYAENNLSAGIMDAILKFMGK